MKGISAVIAFIFFALLAVAFPSILIPLVLVVLCCLAAGILIARNISHSDTRSAPPKQSVSSTPLMSKTTSKDELLGKGDKSSYIVLRNSHGRNRIPDSNGNGIKLRKVDKRTMLKTQDYYVLDVETTGLSRESDRIIELAWIHISGGEEIDSYSTLINPETSIGAIASRITGIENKDVAQAPTYNDIREDVREELLESTVVGHNVSFDLAFICQLIGEAEGEIHYIDTLPLAREASPNLPNYKLDTLCEELSLDATSEHRALQDVKATKELFDRCVLELNRRDQEEKARRKKEREQKKQALQEQYGDSPLFNVSFVYTGRFSMPREAMESLALSVGAVKRENVSSVTDFLVVGDTSDLPDWALGRKLRKAEAIEQQGGRIKRIDEAEYLRLINQAKTALGIT